MADNDIRTLTSFNFDLTETEETEEKLLSKLFTKFKTAVSGSQDSLSDVQPPALKSQTSSSSLDVYDSEAAGSSSLLQGAKRQICVTSPTPPASCKDSVIVNFPSSASTHSLATVSNSTSSATAAPVVAAANRETDEHAPVTRRSQDNQPSSGDDGPILSVPIYRPPSADSDTQSVATTFSISTSHSLSRIIARLRGQKSDKEFWMPDEQCKECYKCHKPFNVLRRRHHCRICGQIFCGKCASHTISGKLYKQKGEVRVCNFCYREHLMGHTEEHVSTTSVVCQPEEDASNDKQYQAIIPSQPPPIAAPKMHIPTAAVKQSQSQYGHSTTVAVELLASDSSPYLGTSSEKNPGSLSRSGSISAGNGNESDSLASPAVEGSFSKRLLDAGSSFLKSRPRSTTVSSVAADDMRLSNNPQALLRGNSATNALTIGRGGGTLVTESALSPFMGRNDEEEDIKDNMLQEFWSRSSSSIPGGGSSLRMPSSSSNNSQGDLANNGNHRLSAGSDDEAYDHRLRDKRTEELRGQASPERSVSFRRQSIGGGKKGRAAFRQKSMHISTTNLPKADFLQNETWSPSPFLSPLEDRYALSPLDHAIKNRLLTPRHRRISAPPPNVELSYGAVMHARKMLKQLMADESFSVLSAQEKIQWEDIIMNLLLKVTDNVRPDVRSGDDMDIRHYIKIKKVPGGLPIDSFYVKGVMCSKNVAHKAMVRNISQPRILILLFSLDYSRVEMENQLMSIEPMIAQEREHIKKLVARIAALRPSLLLVKSTVSRLALEFLLEKNIPVIHNVKYSVIQAVARCTRASIVQSVENLHSADLSFGQCGTFEIRTVIHDWLPNRRKTFLIFDDCQPDLGGTIVLRGARNETLQLLKRLIDFMVFVVHNLKLETSLLRDSFAKNRGLEPDVERERSPLVPDNAEVASQDSGTKTADNSLDGFSKLYEDTILSASQFVVFPPPYVLIQLIETNDKITVMNAARKSSTPQSTVPSSPTKPMMDMPSREPVMDAEYERLVAKRNHLLRAWQAYLKESADYINPFYHQNIVVLYSNVCTVTTVPCQGPEIRMFEYYCQPSDMTLGDYLVELCEDAIQLCPSPMCEHPVLHHYRSYAHGSARINVMIEKFPCPQPGMSDKLLMWSYCRQCEKPTPVIPMSENTYSYSFGKFLEICLYQKGVYCRADICPHDIGQHHVRYFGYKDFAVRFQYDPIELLEVAVPPMKLFMLSQVQVNQKEEDFKNLRAKTNKFYQSIAERNKAFPYDLVNPSRLEECKAELQEMSQRCDSEKKQVLQYIQNVYATTRSTDTLTINWTVRTILYQHIERWDEEYANLVREFLQPERELRKITANLRKVFPRESPEVTGGERTKRATEVTDLPLLGTELEDEAPYDQQSMVPRMLPQLLPSPTGDSAQEEYWKSEQEGRSLLRPEVKRRLSLELLRELKIKLRSEEHPEKSRSAVLATSATAATTPSRIPVLHPGSHHIRTKLSPPWNESLLQNTAERPFMIDESDHISRQKNVIPHYRYSNLLLDSSSNTDRLQSSPFGATRHNSLHVPSRNESESKRLRKALTARDRHFRSRLPRKKTSMQVYTRVNDLVKENMEAEVGDLEDEQGGPIDYFSPLAPYAERVGTDAQQSLFFSQRYDDVAEAITGFGMELERLPPLAVDLLDPPHVNMVAGMSSSDMRQTSEGEEGEEGQEPSARRAALQDVKTQPEKSSFMKTITSFLTDSGVANLLPLEYPLQRSEYIFPDSPVIVREDEPSTIIAYTLSCQDYLTHMKGASDSASELSFDDNPSMDHHETASESATMASPGDIKDILLKESGIHIGFNFRSDSTRFFCKIFFVDQFDALRRNCSCDESYIYSLASCLKWDSSGGKSGSAFLKTKDDRLLMKQLSRFELDAFLKFAPAYFHYMSDAFFREMPTVLAKIFGFYSIGFENSATGKSMHMDVLVMENLFYQRNVKKIFDLKGSMRNRHVQSTGKQDEVLLDENLVELIYQSPLFIRTHSKEILRSSLHNDTLFLGNSNVMDYSLLVGIDEERQELVVGIVDFIRTFTWDKKLESWVKESGILGGGGKEPTIVSPRQYRIRFREAMERYFLMVPDEWSVFRQIRAPFAGLYHHHQQQHTESD